MEPDAPNCPQCEACMLQAPRPLKRMFGDVRAFECSSCGFMILEYASQRLRPASSRTLFDAVVSMVRNKAIPQG
jgi:hypothetical protein